MSSEKEDRRSRSRSASASSSSSSSTAQSGGSTASEGSFSPTPVPAQPSSTSSSEVNLHHPHTEQTSASGERKKKRSKSIESSKSSSSSESSTDSSGSSESSTSTQSTRERRRRSRRGRERERRRSDSDRSSSGERHGGLSRLTRLHDEKFGSLSAKMASIARRAERGIYVAPQRRRELERLIGKKVVKGSEEHQRRTWFKLQKGINGIINRVTANNIQQVLPHLFQYNLVRGKGLLAKALLNAQLCSPTYTHVYAAVLAVINTKLPENGELVVSRVIWGFRKAFQQKNKGRATALVKFIAHLVNQQVAHEVVALQLVQLFFSKPTNDSVELAVEFTKQVGQYLGEVVPRGLHSIFEQFRMILQEGKVDKRTQFLIEGLFQVRKSNFEAFPAILKPQLDLVESDDQITHTIQLADELETFEELDKFQYDKAFLRNEKLWNKIQQEILGLDDSDSDTAASSSSDSSENSVLTGSSDEEMDRRLRKGKAMSDGDDRDEDGKKKKKKKRKMEDGEEDQEGEPASAGVIVDDKSKQEIIDVTESELVEVRRTIYLTIMSSLSHEEAAHKLLQLNIKPGLESELVNMLVECCSQEKTYLKYYGALAERFCLLSRSYQSAFMEGFSTQYKTIHRLETNKIRNIARLFAHLLYSDAMPWTVLETIRLTERDTTSSSRIFVKVLFQELAEDMGVGKLRDRFMAPTMQHYYRNVMPKDDPANTRFSINFFTAIGLGILTDDMREFLKSGPRVQPRVRSDSESSSGSDSSSGSSSSSSSSGSTSDSSSGSTSDSSSDSGSDSGTSRSGSSYSKRRQRRRRRSRTYSSSDTDTMQNAKDQSSRKDGNDNSKKQSPPVASNSRAITAPTSPSANSVSSLQSEDRRRQARERRERRKLSTSSHQSDSDSASNSSGHEKSKDEKQKKTRGMLEDNRRRRRSQTPPTANADQSNADQSNSDQSNAKRQRRSRWDET